jgi:cytochrome c biogenesis factor
MGALGVLVYIADPWTIYAVEHAAPVGSPAGYRIAAVWAGQAGGLLLWCLEIALISLAVKPGSQPGTVAVLAGIQFSLLSLTLASNPFAQGLEERAGLNPLLMSPMMLVHPPMLFLGYALLSMPFAITVDACCGATLPDGSPVCGPGRF